MGTLIDIDLFDNDERVIISKACEGVSVSGFSRSGLLSNLHFALKISVEQDIIDLIKGLITKLENISDDEWDAMKEHIPFSTYLDDDNNVDGVPQNETV